MKRPHGWYVLAFLVFAPAVMASRLPRLVIPQHYTLTVTPDLEAERFAGEVAIEVGVQVPVTTVVLNAAEMTFRRASITAAGDTQEATILADESAERITLTVPRALPVGPATIRIGYDGILNQQLRGFYIGRAYGAKYLASQMEATDARRAFPSFDEPDLKATFQINVVADAAHAVISNAPIEAESAGPVGGKRTVRFGVTPRLSTYHVALIVGDFRCVEGTADAIRQRVCAAPQTIGMSDFALDATDDALRYLNGYFESPYPFEKLDQIALTDFAAGAMENPGAVTYRETVLLADTDTASVQSLRRSTGTIAHELAHMWFGNLVTMRWWDDIWLNEGFATWLSRRTLERIRPEWTGETTAVAAVGSTMVNDVLLSTRPIRKSAETPQEIEQLFDGIAYGKTAALLLMLEEYVGAEKFREGINLYLRRNAFGNASASDFAAAIDDVSGRDVAAILSSYVNQAGVPLVSVRSRCEGDERIVDLHQSRFAAGAGTPAPASAQAWTIPVCFSGGGGCVLLREREQTFRLPGCSPAAFANAGGHGYYITALHDDAYAEIARQPERLSPPERLVLVRDDWFLVRAGRRRLADHLDLATAIGMDRHVAATVLNNLEYVERYLVDDAQRQQLQEKLRRVAAPLLRDLGWTARPDESPEERELRSSAIRFLGESAADPATLQHARSLAARALRDRSAVAPELMADVTRLAAIGGDPRLYDAYLRGYRSSRDPRERSRYLLLLSAFRDPALLRRTLALTLTDEIRSQDIASVLRGVLSNPAGTTMGWRFLEENRDALLKKIPAGHTGRVIGGVAVATCDSAWADRVRRFTAEHPLPDATRAVAQTLEQIESCAAMRDVQRDSLGEWITRR